jgi:murein endopeptidase
LSVYCDKLGTSKVIKIKVRPWYIHTWHIRY